MTSEAIPRPSDNAPVPDRSKPSIGPTTSEPGTSEPGSEASRQDAAQLAVAATAWRVRPAGPKDVPSIDALIRELAEYERELDAVQATPEDLAAALFNSHPRVHCHVVEADGPEGSTVVGIAIWFVTFSTWRGRHGLWLEDLYVQPAFRRLGAGRALLAELAAICTDRGYARMEWWVLDWNEPAHRFYRGIGAKPEEDWTRWRVTDVSLTALAHPQP
jgi:GNAT superfamily N-acetyltransferase